MQNSFPTIQFVFIGIFFLTVIVFGLLFVFSGKENPNPVGPAVGDSTTIDGYGKDVPEIEGKTAVLTKSGRITYVRDFLDDPGVQLVEPSTNTYVLAEEYGIDGKIYQIFHTKNGGFTLLLLDEDLAFARSRGEAKLMEIIPGSQLELCSLELQVATPRFVSDEMSGRQLGLSFCPGSLQL